MPARTLLRTTSDADRSPMEELFGSTSSVIRQSGRRLIAASPAILLVAVILAAWEVYARYSGIKATTLPAPSRVLEQAWINRDALFDNTIPTLYATLLGFACSLTTAFLFSILVDFFAPLRRALFPVLI